MVKLFVGNLPYKATEDDLRDLFSSAGIAADSITVMRDRMSGQSRGFGFVEIADDAQAAQAIQTLNGRELMGRALVVNEARPLAREGGGERGGRRRY